jgi:hypothetical protein
MSSSKASSNTKHKVDLNSKPNHNNPTMQLVCSGSLPTFVPPIIPYVFEIFILTDEGNEPKLQPKKLKTIHDVSHKCKKNWATQLWWAQMFNIDFGEVNHVKCIVCLVAKGKDVILGLKFNTLDKHA